ncbi:MAG: DeoR family transcriptional regulator, aga operon transcriptional repressor [Actinomycetota bacterium]|nr:DeoR family transcriptional regulator, aga operon transcriptional repressor [Actinomycetota bacterium]
MARVQDDRMLRHAASGKRSRRMIEIVELITARGSVSLADLSDALHVSAATVRRDLADLEYQRLIVRTHGGATGVEARTELPVTLRDSQFQDAKRAIARKVASLIPRERHAVALSGGSTTAIVARALSNHSELTIVTNSLTIASLVTSFPGLKVIMTGGQLRHESLELVGVLAENTFNAINVGTAILGTDGISAAGGVTTHDETEARTNNAMVTHAQRAVVVTDGSKVGRIALAKVADIQQIDLLITDDSADPAELERIAALGIEVQVVTVGRGLGT